MRKPRQFRRRQLMTPEVEAFKALCRQFLVFNLSIQGVEDKRDGGSGFLNPVFGGLVALNRILMLIDWKLSEERSTTVEDVCEPGGIPAKRRLVSAVEKEMVTSRTLSLFNML
ncbi:unnamed protein product [Brassica rapa subsp. trilocularis]